VKKLPKVSSRKILLLLFLILLIGLAIFITRKLFLKESPEATSVPQERVLGETTMAPKIFIRGQEEYGGGVVALSAFAEPEVEISSWELSGNAQITVFKAGRQDLLNYLIHDKEGKQLNKHLDTNSLEPVTIFSQQIKSGYKEKNRITLPIENEGIWYLELNLAGNIESVFVVRSKVAALLKEGDGQFIVWGQSFETKKSLEKGTFTAYNLVGQVSEIGNGHLDNQGIAKLPLASEADIGLLEHENDLALVPINLKYLNMGYNYKRFEEKQRQAKFFVFTDRPLYRPGGKIYFKTIIRDDDDVRYTIPQGLAKVKVYKDWKEENLIFEKDYEITPEGTVFGGIEIPEETAAGYYQLKVDLDPAQQGTWEDWRLEGTTSFRIEHFRKPEYSIDIEVPKREFVAGDKTLFKITGEYFSGQALSNQEVSYKITSANFYEYSYVSDIASQLSDDFSYCCWHGREIEKGKAVFNTQGEAEVDLKIKLPEDTKKTQVFAIEAEFDDGSGNPVFARKNILVYPGEYGIYRNESCRTGRANEVFSLPLVLVPHRKTKIKGVSLKANIKRTAWAAHQEPDKKYPTWTKEEEDLPEIKAKSDQEGKLTFEFTPSKKGSYKITVEGKDKKGNLVTKEFNIWVVAQGEPLYKSSGGEKGISIQPEKEKYQHTETAKITISSEISDRDVFLSLDREKVNRFEIVRLENKTKTIEIPLVETDIPNIFVKAASFSDNFLDHDSEQIIVSSDPKKIKVSITADKKRYRPGETVELFIKTTDLKGNPVSADTAVWAVDKAIFELAERHEDIIKTFWNTRWDGTAQAHSLEGINVSMAEGGGGGGGGDIREVFEDTAYWNPKVATDEFGEAKLSFKLPDNLTTWAVAAVSATLDTMVGQTTSEIIVTKDVIVRPILPNILRIGDQLVLGTAVYNYTEESYVFDVLLSFDSGKIMSGNHQEEIKADEFNRFFWKIVPDKENERAELIFASQSTTDKEIGDTIVQKIPVQKFGFWEKTGETAIGNKEFVLNLGKKIDEEKTEINLSLASSLLGSLPSAMKYLIRYPYGCTEQITSRAIPAVLAYQNPDIFGTVLAEKNVQEIIEKAVLKLKSFQNNDGGWLWWPDSPYASDLFITSYVLEFLTESKAAGFAVEDEVLQKAKNYLLQENKPQGFTKEKIVAKNYGLSLLGVETESIRDFGELTPDVLALAVMTNARNGNLNSQTNGLDKLVSMKKAQGDGFFWQAGNDDYFGSKDASTALVIQAILEGGGNREAAAKAVRFLTRNRQKHYWSNTFATAQVVKAIIEFSKSEQGLAPNYQYHVKLDDKILSQGWADDWQKPLEEINMKGAEVKKDSKISVEKLSGQGEIYSTLVVDQFHTDKNAKAVSNNLTVSREYINEKGAEYGLGVGDTVEVRLTLSGLGAEENYGVVVDELPSGMIPINPAFKSEQFTEQKYQKGVFGRQVTENGMILSLRKVGPGTHTYSYKARVVNEGTFNTPPAQASLMYAPEINARSQAEVVKIAGKSKLAPLKAAQEFVKQKSKELWEKKEVVAAIVGGGTVLTLGGWYLVSKKFKIAN